MMIGGPLPRYNKAKETMCDAELVHKKPFLTRMGRKDSLIPIGSHVFTDPTLATTLVTTMGSKIQ